MKITNFNVHLSLDIAVLMRIWFVTNIRCVWTCPTRLTAVSNIILLGALYPRGGGGGGRGGGIVGFELGLGKTRC